VAFVLRRARVASGGALTGNVDLAVDRKSFIAMATVPDDATVLDLDGALVLPALVNAHDHLDASTFPPLGNPPYADVYQWTAEVAESQAARAAFDVPLVDRLFLGGMRNLLSGVGAVAHHGVFHRCLSRPDFPVHVLERYQFAHSPGLTPALRKTYRSTDRRIPWFVHLAEGTSERCREEADALTTFNLLRQNCVAVHAIGLRADDIPKLAAAKVSVVWCPESNRRLYAATAPVRALAEGGVRIGLGSDSPATGVRDLLSGLVAARREAVFSDAELMTLVTTGAAEVARLPLSDLQPGSAADFIAVESQERLLQGDRAAILGVWRQGRLLYGRAEWLSGGVPILVDGEPRVLARPLGERLLALLARYPRIREASWANMLNSQRSDPPGPA
jgi:cytosine/adenosine deaminase-related metal-dependent hydrolase